MKSSNHFGISEAITDLIKFLVAPIFFHFAITTGYSQTCDTTAPTYQTISSACNSGVLTTGSEWNAAASPAPTVGGAPPYTLDVSTDSYTIPVGDVVEIASSNFQLNHNLIVNGTLLVSGFLAMGASNTITVGSGGLVTCCASGYCTTCASCGASDKIKIGTVVAYCGTSCGFVQGSFTGPATLSSSGLPVTLTSFNGIQKLNSIEVNWSTASEINFNYFILEKSGDGQQFSELAKVNGQGNSNVRHDYSFEDEKPFIGKNFYRLKETDFDNSVTMLQTIAVEYSGKKSVSIYPNPNPANGQINIEFNHNLSNVARAFIYNLQGVLQAQIEIGDRHQTINQNLPPGLYIIKVVSDDLNVVDRIMVQDK